MSERRRWTLEAKWCEECGWQDVAVEGPDLGDTELVSVEVMPVSEHDQAMTDLCVELGLVSEQRDMLAVWLEEAQTVSDEMVKRARDAYRKALLGPFVAPLQPWHAALSAALCPVEKEERLKRAAEHAMNFDPERARPVDLGGSE